MKLEQYIDHTNLKASVNKEEIIKLCEEAKKHQFKSVCVNPCWVKFVSEQLKDTNVLTCTVIGFPLGQNTTKVKVFEAEDAIANGADEVDMVINISELKNKNEEYILNEINAIKKSIKNKTLKVIVETALLTEEEKIIITNIVLKSNADFIKTSTGFSTGGATEADIKLFNSILENKKAIKASGGVKSFQDAETMIKAGATRIGTSGGCAIIQGQKNTNDY